MNSLSRKTNDNPLVLLMASFRNSSGEELSFMHLHRNSICISTWNHSNESSPVFQTAVGARFFAIGNHSHIYFSENFFFPSANRNDSRMNINANGMQVGFLLLFIDTIPSHLQLHRCLCNLFAHSHFSYASYFHLYNSKIIFYKSPNHYIKSFFVYVLINLSYIMSIFLFLSLNPSINTRKISFSNFRWLLLFIFL